MSRSEPLCAERRALLLGALASACMGSVLCEHVPRYFLAGIRTFLAWRQTGYPHAELARTIVFGDSSLENTIEGWSDSRLRQAIRRNITSDYRRGRVVPRAGWRISVTEARALELAKHLGPMTHT